VFGSASGWAATIKHTPHLREMFDAFITAPHTFSLGICNGCQLMTRLGWLGEPFEMKHNESNRFESRFVTLKIKTPHKSNREESVWFKNMNDMVFGGWVAHGEGRFDEGCVKDNSCHVRYVHPVTHNTTNQYPYNPNGSAHGVAGMVSLDGRHLGMMPHPERSVLNWQLPWSPQNYKPKTQFTAWIKLFQNAYDFACK